MKANFKINQRMNARSFNADNSLEKHFNTVAYLIMNHSILEIDKNSYRLTEIEFYFYNEDFHEDPYIHKHRLQLMTGQWYFHGSGLDITFGDGKNYGGILIRGIKSLTGDENSFISGPLNVVQEIFSSFGNIGIKDHLFRIIETNDIPSEDIVKSTRVGLKEKEPTGFKEKYYRYLTCPFEPGHKYTEKTIVAQSMLKNEIKLRSYSKKEINDGFKWKILK
ncbi:MAG: hypothetical protein JXB49_18605 [Bacteroidales bacterium]|nr:hypothetical protein [Bacteroidales bacterium]